MGGKTLSEGWMRMIISTSFHKLLKVQKVLKVVKGCYKVVYKSWMQLLDTEDGLVDSIMFYTFVNA